MHLHTMYLRKLVMVILFALVLASSACDISPGTSKSSNSSSSNGPGTTNSASVIQRHGAEIPVSPGSSATSNSSCQGKEQMVGGGYYIAGNKVSADVSYPSTQNSWVATLRNTTHKTLHITAFVDCLVADFTINTKLIIGENAGVNSNDGSKMLTVRARCPDGSILTGGGYLTETLSGTVEVSSPDKDQNQWLVISHSLGHNPMKVQSFAICATAHLSAMLPRLHGEFTIAGGADAQSTKSCPEDALLTSGGYATSDVSVPGTSYAVNSPDSVAVSSPGPVTQWLIGGSSFDGKPHQVSIWVVCIKLN